MYFTIDGADLPRDYPDIGFFDIDREVFAAHYQNLSPSELGSGSLSRAWYAQNPSIYTLLMHAGNVVGYCNIMPVTQECFEALMAGVLNDGDIPASSVCSFSNRNGLFLYICGIAIMPSHQGSPAALLTLLRGVRKKFWDLQLAGVLIREVGAIAWNDIGGRVATLWGLSPTAAPCALGVVYRGQPNRWFGKLVSL